MTTRGKALIPLAESHRALTAEEFHTLADIPPEAEWFANLKSDNTKAAYRKDVAQFMQFVGIQKPEEFRMITRAHVIAWRDELMRPKTDTGDQVIEDSTIRRKLSALSSLFNHLCDCNAVTHNPVKGVKRPSANYNEGSTPALSDEQALALLEAPDESTLKGKRDRAILAVLLFGALRRQELCDLRVKDYQMRSGVRMLKIRGKGRKVRYVEAEATTQRLLTNYLDTAGHADDLDGPLFRPVRNPRTRELRKPLYPTAVYHNVVQFYARKVGITVDVRGFCVHSLRKTAASSALNNGASLAHAQKWMGHANISTTRLYWATKQNPEDSPSFRIRYEKGDRERPV